MNNLKISNLLKNISFKLRSASTYFEIKHYVLHKENYLKKIHSWDRNIGKTYSLVKLARKFGLPIIVANHSNEDYIRYIENRCFRNSKHMIKVIVMNESIRGKRLEMALIDEGIDDIPF